MANNKKRKKKKKKSRKLLLFAFEVLFLGVLLVAAYGFQMLNRTTQEERWKDIPISQFLVWITDPRAVTTAEIPMLS